MLDKMQNCFIVRWAIHPILRLVDPVSVICNLYNDWRIIDSWNIRGESSIVLCCIAPDIRCNHICRLKSNRQRKINSWSRVINSSMIAALSSVCIDFHPLLSFTLCLTFKLSSLIKVWNDKLTLELKWKSLLAISLINWLHFCSWL